MTLPSRPSATESVQSIATRLRLSERLAPYEPWRWKPTDAAGPTLHLEDVSAIPFLVDIAGVEEYQHRARVRANDGDLYATVTTGDARYETYCRETLDLGDVTRLAATPPAGCSRLAVAAGCLSGPPFDHLVAVARNGGRLLIHPYMSIEPAWDLAARVAAESNATVRVLGPPPPVTWIANDKALFDEVVNAVLGSGWTPATREATKSEALAAHLHELSRAHATVGLKRTRCASSMGNEIFHADDIRDASPAEVERVVRQFLTRTQWPGDESVLAVAWERATVSPSTQWWIPPSGHGPPRLDGIYEQLLEGERRVFVGSRPSTLPGAVHRMLGMAAGRVAEALQALGYVGRCSFDHLVMGEPDGDFEIRFTECNGRWGGTSTPMHLVDRLVTAQQGRRPPYRAQDVAFDALVGARFEDVLARVGDTLFDPHRRCGRYIFYNVGPIEAFGKLDVIALGSTPADAERAMRDDLPRILGV